MFDRIELGTYLIVGSLIGQRLKIQNADSKIIKTEIKTLKKMGIKLKLLPMK